MSAPLVVWVFMILMQQQGMSGGVGADLDSCRAARLHMLEEIKAMSGEVLAVSECVQVTLTPPTK